MGLVVLIPFETTWEIHTVFHVVFFDLLYFISFWLTFKMSITKYIHVHPNLVIRVPSKRRLRMLWAFNKYRDSGQQGRKIAPKKWEFVSMSSSVCFGFFFHMNAIAEWIQKEYLWPFSLCICPIFQSPVNAKKEMYFFLKLLLFQNTKNICVLFFFIHASHWKNDSNK